MNILIVKLSALGDVTHTLPALTALRRAYPEARIDWLVEETAAPIVEGHVALDRALVWSRRRFTQALRAGRIGEAWKILRSFVRELRSTSYDLILDFQALLKSGIWVLVARGQRKVGFGPGMDRSEGSFIFLNERIPAVSMEIHALDRGLMLLEAIGIPRAPVDYQFPVTESARDHVTQCLHALPMGNDGGDVERRGEPGSAPECSAWEVKGTTSRRPLIVIHPMTRWPTKLWSVEAFAETADALTELGFRVVLTGSAQDRETLDAMVVRLRRPVLRLDGQLDLKGLGALFERSDVVISTDTGPMHIAAAVGTPVVALFGPTAPNRTGPYGAGHIVLRGGVSCSPCFSRQCVHPAAEPLACMQRIRPAAVVEAVKHVLARSILASADRQTGEEPPWNKP